MSWETYRPWGRFFYGRKSGHGWWKPLAANFAVGACVIALGLLVQAQSGPATTHIADTVYRADGTPASGVLLISWPPFTTAGGAAVAAGTSNVTLGASGALGVDLVPNTGANPASAYYTVVYQLDDNSVRTEYWLVPATTRANLAAVRTIPGTGTAAALASKQYVDSEVAAKASDTSVVHLAGGETIAGTKQFAVSPSLPAPVNASDAVNKSYVDAAVASVGAGAYVAKAGDTMSGPLNLSGDPVSTNSASTKHYVDTSVAGKASLVGGVVPPAQLGSGPADGTVCLKGNSSWGACGTSTNAVSIQGVPVDPTAPADGQVVTYVASTGKYTPKAGGSGNATALQGVPLDTAAPSDGQVMTYVASAGKYTPKSGGGLSSAIQTVKYATDLAWTASPATDLSAPGAKTVSLSSCPTGVVASEKYYYVYVSGSGSPEAVLVTGGTCMGNGAAGTLQFTTATAQCEVIDKLGRLEAKMDMLVGNGQPGRMKLAEDRIRTLEHANERRTLLDRLVSAAIAFVVSALIAMHDHFGLR